MKAEWVIRDDELCKGYKRVAHSQSPEALAVLQDFALEGDLSVEDVASLAHVWEHVAPVFPSAFSAMEGETLLAVQSGEGGMVIETNVGEYRFVPEGDCCAYAYIAEQPSAEELAHGIGQKIIKWEIGDASVETDDDDYGGQTDTQFYTLHVGREMFQFTLRTEHNGYYSGWLNAHAPKAHRCEAT